MLIFDYDGLFTTFHERFCCSMFIFVFLMSADEDSRSITACVSSGALAFPPLQKKRGSKAAKLYTCLRMSRSTHARREVTLGCGVMLMSPRR